MWGPNQVCFLFPVKLHKCALGFYDYYVIEYNGTYV